MSDATIVLLGDEPACAGFRLAGVDARCPPPADLPAAFEQALADAQLVMLTATLAAALPAGLLRRAQARERPLVMVMPDLARPQADLAFTRRLRAVLGIET